MTSPARMAANARNAKLSKGPTSAAGKERSRMNAVKHGMTAKLVLLPDESLTDFRQNMEGWFDALKPRTLAEACLAENAAYHAWQLDRARRAGSARLCASAQRRRR